MREKTWIVGVATEDEIAQLRELGFHVECVAEECAAKFYQEEDGALQPGDIPIQVRLQKDLMHTLDCA